MKRGTAICLLAAAAVFGQDIDLSAWDKLASKAKQKSVVTLNGETLGLATSMLPDSGADGKQLKDVVSKLKGVVVRNYEFAAKGAYTQADVDAVRKQLGGPGWTKFMDVKGDDEQVEMWFHKDASGSGGLTILAAEPKELTFVHISGPGDLGSLMKASKMVKGMNGDASSGSKKKPAPKEDEDDDNDDN